MIRTRPLNPAKSRRPLVLPGRHRRPRARAQAQPPRRCGPQVIRFLEQTASSSQTSVQRRAALFYPISQLPAEVRSMPLVAGLPVSIWERPGETCRSAWPPGTRKRTHHKVTLAANLRSHPGRRAAHLTTRRPHLKKVPRDVESGGKVLGKASVMRKALVGQAPPCATRAITHRPQEANLAGDAVPPPR